MEQFLINFTKTSRDENVAPIEVAKIAVEFDCRSITIDGTELPEQSIKYLIGYGLKQTLADSYAQLTTSEKINKAFVAKLQNVLEGAYEFDGENGNRGDPVRAEMRQLATLAVLGGKSRAAWVKANGENAEKTLNAKINKVLELNADKLRVKAESIVAERKMELDLDLDDDTESEEPAPVLIKRKRA